MSASTKSDWSEYYQNNDYAVPEFIDNALWRNYERMLRKHLADHRAPIVVTELGGANSVYYRRFKESFNIQKYNIVDNNEVGLKLFPHTDDPQVTLNNIDLMEPLPAWLLGSSDVVVSSGLIEHFTPADTERLLKLHFDVSRPRGLVLVSFPTPTLIYRGFRRFLEMTGKFPPLYERPILESEIQPIVNALGETLDCYKIWTTILTQLFFVVRTSGDTRLNPGAQPK